MVAGQGLAGLSVSLLSFLTIWLNPPHTHLAPTPADVRPAAFAYFTCAAAVMGISLLGYLAFPYMPFAQLHTLPEGSLRPCHPLEGLQCEFAGKHLSSVVASP